MTHKNNVFIRLLDYYIYECFTTILGFLGYNLIISGLVIILYIICVNVLFYLIGDSQVPGVRERVLKYIPLLKEKGINSKIYTAGDVPAGKLAKLKFYSTRFINDLKWADAFYNYRVLFSSKELFLIKQFSKKIIFDFDDAIFDFPVEPKFSEKEKKARTQRLKAFINACDKIIAGNSYLKSETKQRFGKDSEIIPTCLDMDYYKPGKSGASETTTIGWTGMSANNHYLKETVVPLKMIKEKYAEKVRIKIVSDRAPDFFDFKFEFKKWELNNEISDLHSFDIGIMPLSKEDEWAKGKCSFKALQYMAVEKPVVLTPLGMNKDVISDGKEGFFAETQKDWTEKLIRLIIDRPLRQKMGKFGRERVQKYYSKEIALDKLLCVISA